MGTGQGLGHTNGEVMDVTPSPPSMSIAPFGKRQNRLRSSHSASYFHSNHMLHLVHVLQLNTRIQILFFSSLFLYFLMDVSESRDGMEPINRVVGDSLRSYNRRNNVHETVEPWLLLFMSRFFLVSVFRIY